MTFYDVLERYDLSVERDTILAKSDADVLRALSAPALKIQDFKALISPAAERFLDKMAIRAEALTQQRFGKTVQMYVPLYLSNYCINACVYCGFNHANKILRKKLSMDEVAREADAIRALGFKHILLVAGEAPKQAGIDFYVEVVRFLRPYFAQISIEVQPLKEEEYRRLVDAGVSYVCVYQETYDKKAYPLYHPHGLKADFRYRLETPDRAASGGIKKIGIGALLGLEDWRTDALCTALHLRYLEKTYWRTKYSISLPRLRPNVGGYEPKDPITDKQMAQLICAFRIFDSQVDISLSTRESARFRDMAMRIGATTMSAGSSTRPGGYADPHEELEQFAINDNRTPVQMQAAIRAQGYEPIWKDWDEWI